jgi:uncharacterized protein (DUF302 family)
MCPSSQGHADEFVAEQRSMFMTNGEVSGEVGDVVTKASPRPVADTVTRLTELVAAKGMKVFAVIDQTAEARQVGLELRPTTLVLFGSPTAGTPVMAAVPFIALDLPLKVLVWEDGGQVLVSYESPAALAARRGLPADLAPNLAGIDGLTDALVEPETSLPDAAGQLTSPWSRGRD